MPENILIRDAKSSGTNGGAFTGGAWDTRDLTEIVYNDGNTASLASNQITLPAGTYIISASAPANDVDHHKLRIYDITNTAVLAIGSSEVDLSNFGNLYDKSYVTGRFTLAGTTVIEIQHYTDNAGGTTAKGRAISLGIDEIYTTVEITRP